MTNETEDAISLAMAAEARLQSMVEQSDADYKALADALRWARNLAPAKRAPSDAVAAILDALATREAELAKVTAERNESWGFGERTLQRAVLSEAELTKATAERARLRKLFDDAGQGEHNVLALVDHHQDAMLKAETERDELRAALAKMTEWRDKADRQRDATTAERDEARAELTLTQAEVTELRSRHEAAAAQATEMRDHLATALATYDETERTYEAAYYAFMKDDDWWESIRAALAAPDAGADLRDRLAKVEADFRSTLTSLAKSEVAGVTLRTKCAQLHECVEMAETFLSLVVLNDKRQTAEDRAANEKMLAKYRAALSADSAKWLAERDDATVADVARWIRTGSGKTSGEIEAALADRDARTRAAADAQVVSVLATYGIKTHRRADGALIIDSADPLRERLAAARAAALEEAAKAAMEAKLPKRYQWGSDAMESFTFGAERAAQAIRALASKPEGAPLLTSRIVMHASDCGIASGRACDCSKQEGAPKPARAVCGECAGFGQVEIAGTGAGDRDAMDCPACTPKPEGGGK